MNLRQGDKLIDFACRHPDGSMKHANGRTRQIAFCPDCQFEYKGPGCIFTPTCSNGQAFGKNASAKPRREYAPRKVSNYTGGRWTPEAILEVIVEYYERRGKWPLTTTAYRDSSRLPHSQTVKHHFPGGIEEAVKQAKDLLEKEIAERD